MLWIINVMAFGNEEIINMTTIMSHSSLFKNDTDDVENNEYLDLYDRV